MVLSDPMGGEAQGSQRLLACRRVPGGGHFERKAVPPSGGVKLDPRGRTSERRVGIGRLRNISAPMVHIMSRTFNLITKHRYARLYLLVVICHKTSIKKRVLVEPEKNAGGRIPKRHCTFI